MRSRLSIWIGILVGSTIGGLIPMLWGEGTFSYLSVLLSGAGALRIAPFGRCRADWELLRDGAIKRWRPTALLHPAPCARWRDTLTHGRECVGFSQAALEAGRAEIFARERAASVSSADVELMVPAFLLAGPTGIRGIS
jgi:hypothetical protein